MSRALLGGVIAALFLLAEDGVSKSVYPPLLDLRLAVTPDTEFRTGWLTDKISLIYQEPLSDPLNDLDPDPHDKVYKAKIALDADPTARFVALVAREPSTSYRPRGRPLPKTPICLRWAPQLPGPGAKALVSYSCKESGSEGTCQPAADDVGWLVPNSPCDTRADLAPARSRWAFLDLVSAAQASPPTPGWITPSLAALQRLSAERRIGFTRFDVSAPANPGLAADRVTVELYVNGSKLLIDGVDPAEAPRPYQPDQPFHYAFGVQTLDMDGRDKGCNRLEVVVRYARKKEVLAVHRLAQNYAAMRQPAPVETQVGDVDYRWTGEYVRSSEPEDTVIFASSSARSGAPADLDAALERIEGARKAFNDAELTSDDGLPLRAVLRPPLTNPAYGLAAAVVEPSGQLRFTYARAEARKLSDRLKAYRVSKPELANFIAENLWVNPEVKDKVLPCGTFR